MSTACILVADDDRLVLATLTRGMRNAGYSVLPASNGKEAVQIGIREKPALAVLDIRMPDMSGIEVARRLKEETETPFLFLSAYHEPKLVAEATEEGALGYLVKPIDVAKLIPAVEAALLRGAEIRELEQEQSKLNQALSRDKTISIAVGILMERYHLSSSEAFEVLRLHARSKRQKLADVAKQTVEAADRLNEFIDDIEEHIKNLRSAR